MSLSMRSRLFVVVATLLLLTTAWTAGCSRTEEIAAPAEDAPPPPDPAREAREAARAEDLAKDLAALAEIDVSETRAALARWQPQMEKLGVWPEVEKTFETLGLTTDELEKIATFAKEGNAAAIVEPAISGMLTLDPILARESAKFEADQQLFIDLINRDASAKEMEKVNRDIAVGGAIFATAGKNFALFSIAATIVARNAPPDTRRAAFGALETALPRVTYGRKHVERAMLLCHGQEEDSPTRARFEATMARLDVPLAAPEIADTATAAEAGLVPTP